IRRMSATRRPASTSSTIIVRKARAASTMHPACSQNSLVKDASGGIRRPNTFNAMAVRSPFARPPAPRSIGDGQRVLDPLRRQLLLHRILPQSLVEGRKVHIVERLVLVEA